MNSRPASQSDQNKKPPLLAIRGAKEAIVSACFVVAALTPAPVAAANPERYCDEIAKLATIFVDYRNQGWSYGKTLGSINGLVARASLSADDARIFRRDARITAKWVYIDYPAVSSEGMYKLARVICMSD